MANYNTLTVRQYRKDAASVAVTVRKAAEEGDRPRDYATLAYLIAGIASGVVRYDENGRMVRGTGKAWQDATGVAVGKDGADDKVVGSRRLTLARAAVTAYEVRLAADDVTVDWSAADDETVHAAIGDILSVGSLESQYESGSEPKVRPARTWLEALATAARIAPDEVDEDAFIAAARAAFAARGGE